MLYDVFICHASEDKETLVRPMAEQLRAHRVEVWYDEFCLRPGDSLRRAIDKGLASSRLGVVVLSPSFFAKSWPHWELDGLVQRELSASDPVIVPVWHGVTHRDVLSYSPPLADKVAIPSSDGPEGVARKLLTVIHPQGSTLLVARDLVLDFGGTPPVVTDDWWLDAVEENMVNPVEDTFQAASGWGRWGFPLPHRGATPNERGERLGWAAMQMMWKRAAREQMISQVTRPEQVLRFIDQQPGLTATCESHRSFLAAYAPQLVIPGLGGALEHLFEEALASSREVPEAGDGSPSKPRRSTRYEWLALRHPQFETFDAATVACDFVSGYPMSFGPDAKVFAIIDYVAWFLSDASDWLPRPHHRFLLLGLKQWAMWPWFGQGRSDDSEYEFPQTEVTGSLHDEMQKAANARRKRFVPTRRAEEDLLTRLEFAKRLLGLPDAPEELVARFKREAFIEEWFAQRKNGMVPGSSPRRRGTR